MSKTCFNKINSEGSVAEWSKALVLGTSRKARVRIPPLSNFFLILFLKREIFENIFSR